MEIVNMKGRTSMAARWLVALSAALGLMAIFAPGAGAVLVHVGHGRVAGILPRHGVKPTSIPGSFASSTTGAGGATNSASAASTSAGTLVYHNGQVLHSEAPYLIFWDPNGQLTATERSNLEQYFSDAAAASGQSSNIYGVDRQFTDTTGFADYSQTWSSAQALVDTQAYPASGCNVSTRVAVSACLSDGQIQTEVARLITANGWPTGVGTSGAAPIYFVVTPPNVDTCDSGNSVCADNYYCAYHSNFARSGATILYADLPTYLDATDPKSCQYDGNSAVQEPNGNQISDVVTSSMSHEFSETITDPVNGGGWWNPSSGNEDGDNCAFYAASANPAKGNNPDAFMPTLGGSASGTLYDQIINGGDFYTQTEWSNGDGTCKAQPTSSALSAAFSAPSGAVPDATVSFDPSASSSAGGYTSTTWNFGDGTSSFSPSGPTAVTHSYSSPGSYTVTLTLVDMYGNVSAASQTVDVAVITPSFNVDTASPKVGSPVSFDGSASGGPISSYSWDFGDGATDSTSGAHPAHTYTAPGTYDVTLTVSDQNGDTAFTDHQVKVAAAPMAVISFAPAHPVARVRVSFSGAGSTDTGSTVTSYSWAFGDGTGSSAASPAHTYAKPGKYTVRLTVVDATGSSASSTETLSVGSAGITRVKVRTGKRIEQIRLSLSGPGVLSTGTHRFRIKQPETFVYRLKLTPGQAASLSSHRVVHIRLVFKFVPSSGQTLRRTVSFVVKP